jgi:hypothetical protein
MPNGAHALAVLATDPPVKAAVPGEVERSSGEAMADAAIMICAGVEDRKRTGRGLASVSRVCMLQLGHFGDDFGSVARAEGRRELYRRYGAALRDRFGAKLNAAALDASLSEILDWVLWITDRVVADEPTRGS